MVSSKNLPAVVELHVEGDSLEVLSTFPEASEATDSGAEDG